MKNSLDKKIRQDGIVSEFCQAQQKGFVLQIEVELHDKYGKIVYEPMWQMYRNNEANEPTSITQPDDLKDLPAYIRLLVTFDAAVNQTSISKIAKYVCARYKCRSELLTGNKIVFFEF